MRLIMSIKTLSVYTVLILDDIIQNALIRSNGAITFSLVTLKHTEEANA